jgi:hypothetical protein
MAEFSNNTATTFPENPSAKSKVKVGKGTNTSALVMAIEDSQVDELYDMDDWGKIILLRWFPLYFVVIFRPHRKLLEDLQGVGSKMGR